MTSCSAVDGAIKAVLLEKNAIDDVEKFAFLDASTEYRNKPQTAL